MNTNDGSESGGRTSREPNTVKPSILLVDDTAIIRRVYTEILVKSGFSVVQAADAGAARDRILEGVAIDLLLTDHRQPGMNGVVLAKWFQSQRPNIPVVLMSSETEQVRLARQKIAWLHGHEKPSSPKELLRIVQSALGSAARLRRKLPVNGTRTYFNFQNLENPARPTGYQYRGLSPAYSGHPTPVAARAAA